MSLLSLLPLTSSGIPSGFAGKIGITCPGNIWEVIDEEAEKRVASGEFASKDKAKASLQEEYEAFIKTVPAFPLQAAINIYSIGQPTHTDIHSRIQTKLAEIARLKKEFDEIWVKEALPAIQAQKTNDDLNHATEKCRNLYQQMRKIGQFLGMDSSGNADQNRVRENIAAQHRMFAGFLRECRRPGSLRNSKVFVQSRVETLQNAYQEAREARTYLTRADSDLAAQMRAIEKILGPDPLHKPCISRIEKQALALEEFVDLGNSEQVQAFILQTEEEIEALSQKKKEFEGRRLQFTSGLEAIENEYQKNLDMLSRDLPGIGAMIPLMYEEDFHYEGPCQKDVEHLLALYRLQDHSKGRIDELEYTEAQLNDKIEERMILLGMQSETENLENIDNNFIYFIWMARGRPKNIEVNRLVREATGEQLAKARFIALSHKQVQNFHTLLQANDFTQEKAKDYWEALLNSNNQLEGLAAQYALHALSIATHCASGLLYNEGKEHNFAYTYNHEDELLAIREATKRLEMNRMSLLKDDTAIAAIKQFIQTLQNPDDQSTCGASSAQVEQAYLAMKEQSPDAADFFLQAVHSTLGYDTISSKENTFLQLLQNENIDYRPLIYNIAQEISRFHDEPLHIPTDLLKDLS